MDCLCCADGGVGPDSDTEFLGSVCNLKTADGKEAKFPVEAGRYTLYLIAGCPFAARPWSVMAFYGMCSKIQVIKLFPASYEDGWFFEPKSQGEFDLCASFPAAKVDKDPNYDCHHLSELYQKAKPGFKGAISVPLLWDSVEDTAVSNSSLGLAEMISTQMRSMATRNTDVLLFPSRSETPELYQEHDKLVKMLHSRVTRVVYQINAGMDGIEHDDLVIEYYATLDELQERIKNNGPYLMGKDIRFADMVLFISLIRLDLAYQWRFGLGKRSIHENYPVLTEYTRGILKLEGMAETVLPRDIMALYFMTSKFVQKVGRALPMVPESWQNKMMGPT